MKENLSGKVYEPPVTNITLPATSGMSFSGSKEIPRFRRP